MAAGFGWEELARRVGKRMRSFDYMASMDFGLFDGSCTRESRDIAENITVVALCKDANCLKTGTRRLWLEKAITDRIKEECGTEAGFIQAVTALIKDMIRESADRSAPMLNHLTNLALFLASMPLMLEQIGVKDAEIT